MKRLALLAIAFFSIGPSAASAQSTPEPAGYPTGFIFRSELSGVYRLEHVALRVDGVVVHEGQGPFTLILPPGTHPIELTADYRLHDNVLTYMDAYRMELDSKYVAKPLPGQALVVEATVVPTGGLTTPIQHRATVRWRDLPPQL